MSNYIYRCYIWKILKKIPVNINLSICIFENPFIKLCNCIIYASFLKCLILFYADGLKYVRKAAILRKNSFLNIAASVKAFRCYTGTGLLTAVWRIAAVWRFVAAFVRSVAAVRRIIGVVRWVSCSIAGFILAAVASWLVALVWAVSSVVRSIAAWVTV